MDALQTSLAASFSRPVGSKRELIKGKRTENETSDETLWNSAWRQVPRDYQPKLFLQLAPTFLQPSLSTVYLGSCFHISTNIRNILFMPSRSSTSCTEGVNFFSTQISHVFGYKMLKHTHIQRCHTGCQRETRERWMWRNVRFCNVLFQHM